MSKTQTEKAAELLALHTGGNLLLLPNVWNPIGARILAVKGYPAVATASAALSASLGYVDGEQINRSTLIEFIGRIARSVEVPVTADIEMGYANSLAELQETINLVIESGVVGINLEDSVQEGGALRPVDEQCQRISTVRQAANRHRVHLVINARVDAFLSSSLPDKGHVVEAAAVRAKAYAEAGADCIYPIGPGDETTVRMLRDRIQSPINILASPAAAPLSVLKQIGVNRVSFGPFIFRACLKKFVDIVGSLHAADSLHTDGDVDEDYACLRETMSSTAVCEYLRTMHE
jgi:2-methylisocitrate lyase-like PEP mutase family enzyme